MATLTAVKPAVKKPRTRPGAPLSDRSVQIRVQIIWFMMFLNVLTFTKGVSVIPIPSVIGKGITQASLQIALTMALLLNRRVLFRPSVYLSLVSLLAFETILTLFVTQHLKGTAYRTFRFIEFVAVLWLLTPYWGRRDLLLLRCHLKSMGIVLYSVALGFCIAPGRAYRGGRLGGVIWSIPPTQVAHYAAITMGMVIILWLTGRRQGRSVVFRIIPCLVILLLTHTRTALLAMLLGVLVGGLTVFLVNARVRKTFVTAALIIGAAVTFAAGPLTTWLARGQNAQQLNNLTGRTNFWGPLLAFPRSRFEEIFGFGLSNGTFNGLPVDSNWLLSYQDQGLYGDVVCGLILIVLLIKAMLESRRFERAMGTFFVVYCLVASFTEVGYTNPSPYMLDLAICASLLVPVVAKREIVRPH
jgi:hypothetical protein